MTKKQWNSTSMGMGFYWIWYIHYHSININELPSVRFCGAYVDHVKSYIEGRQKWYFSGVSISPGGSKAKPHWTSLDVGATQRLWLCSLARSLLSALVLSMALAWMVMIFERSTGGTGGDETLVRAWDCVSRHQRAYHKGLANNGAPIKSINMTNLIKPAELTWHQCMESFWLERCATQFHFYDLWTQLRLQTGRTACVWLSSAAHGLKVTGHLQHSLANVLF